MCRDNEHGGHRCPDSSDKRRLRRKAANLLSSYPTQEPFITTVAPIKPLKKSILVEAERLKALVYSEPADGVTQEEHDATVELQITNFGAQLAVEAEKLAGFDKEALTKELEENEKLILTEALGHLHQVEEEKEQAKKAWFDLCTKRNLDIFIQADNLSDEQIDSLSDEERDIVENYMEKTEDLNEIVRKYNQIMEEVDKTNNDRFYKENKKLASAYQQVISGIRPIGGEVKFEDNDSDKDFIGVMKDTVAAHYPSEWLQKHNDEIEPVKFLVSDNRPHYAPVAFSETVDGIEKYKPTATTLTVNPTFAQKLNPLFNDSNINFVKATGKAYGIDGNTNVNIFHFSGDEEEAYDERFDGNFEDWKKQSSEPLEYKVAILDPKIFARLDSPKTEEEGYDQLMKTRWVRKVVTTKKIEKRLTGFLPMSDEEKKNKKIVNPDYHEAVAYHEFGHRMEEILPNKILPRQEKAFLKRRTNKTEENFHNNLINITLGLQEYAHEGGFVDKYVGRDYFTNNNYEVFTTGIESLYSGSYGGLVGNGITTKPDPDHRNFILGILATL